MFFPTSFHLFLDSFAHVASDLSQKNEGLKRYVLLDFVNRIPLDSDLAHLQKASVFEGILFHIISDLELSSLSCFLSERVGANQFYVYECDPEKVFEALSSLRKEMLTQKTDLSELTAPKVFPGPKKIRPVIDFLKSKILPIVQSKPPQASRFSLEMIFWSLRNWFLSVGIKIYQMTLISFHFVKAFTLNPVGFSAEQMDKLGVDFRFRWSQFLFSEIYLEKLQPSLLVLGSDQGEKSQLYVLEACLAKKIPVSVLVICDVEKRIWSKVLPNRILGALTSMNRRWLRFLKASYFQGNLIGTYSRKTILFSTNPEITSNLIGRSRVSRKRIVPVYPILKPSNRELSGEQPSSFERNKKWIVYFSENLSGIYGEVYERELVRDLAREFKMLQSQGFGIVAKLHPHEPLEIENIYRDKFEALGIQVLRDADFVPLIEESFICMGHFSRLLQEAVYRNKFILCINLHRDRRGFLTRLSRKELEVQDLGRLSNRVLQIAGSSEASMGYQTSFAQLRSHLLDEDALPVAEVISEKFLSPETELTL